MLLDKPIPLLFFIRKIRREALLVFLFANAVVLVKLTFNLWNPTIPIAIPTLLGTCISLLLAFRTFENRPTDTAMTTIARTIEINLKTMIGYEPVPDRLVAESYYAL